MTLRKLTNDDIRELVGGLPFELTDEGTDQYREDAAGLIDVFEEIEALPPADLPPSTVDTEDRESGWQPSGDDDPYNAWIRRCQVEGADDGLLSGTTVGLKDNVAVAGIEMTCGSSLLDGFVPEVDATIVRRLLDAGATISGKTNLHSLCFGSSSYGRTENPTAPEYTVGGSSSGSAAAVAAGDVDVGIGTDQGGSVRVPASFTGLVGLKPTHGLVPYTGVVGCDDSLDHVGLITRSVKDAADVLAATAGADGLDHRQPDSVPVGDVTDSLGQEISDVSVGVLEDGFEHDVGHSGVYEAVREELEAMSAAGTELTQKRLPEHSEGGKLSLAIITYGMARLFDEGATSLHRGGWYDVRLKRRFVEAVRDQGDELPELVKTAMLTSEHLHRQYQGRIYAKAQNRVMELREKYDALLEDVDVLAMPTVPGLPDRASDFVGFEEESDDAGFVAAKNTAIFNLTGHPAISVPCGTVEGAPVGMMFVAERFDEATLLAVADAYMRL